MPTVTVQGSGAAPLNYNTLDAFSYAQNAAIQISTAISGGATPFQETGGASGPSSGSFTAVFSSTPAPATAIGLGTNAIAVVDALTGPLLLQGGAAGQTVIAASGGLQYGNITASGLLTDNIVAGDGANYIGTGLVGGTGNYIVNTGAGNDTIAIFNGNATINAGTGRNLIQLGGGLASGNSYVYSEGADSITGNTIAKGLPGAGGTDTVFIGSGAATINPGSSNIFVYPNQFNALSVLQGVGSDTVVVGRGGGSVVGGLGGNNYLFGGVGGAGSAGTTIRGGGEGDHLFAIGGGSVTIIGGAGAETITGAVSPGGFGSTASTGNNLFQAGSGNDTLMAGGGADTLQGGSGLAVMSSGTGADTFLFVKGSSGGADTITGFKAADTLQVSGYGLNAATLFNTALVTSAGTVLTLNDGTTITLSGITNTSTIKVSAT